MCNYLVSRMCVHLFCRASKLCEDFRARKQRHLREPNKQKGRVFNDPAFLFYKEGIYQSLKSRIIHSCWISLSLIPIRYSNLSSPTLEIDCSAFSFTTGLA